jgi:hypothetical protein
LLAGNEKGTAMRVWAMVLLAGVAAPAWAQDEPRFCPNRPTLGLSACTTEPGHVHMELSVADWERDDTADEWSDTILGGDVQARIGVGPSTEVQVGWEAVGYSRTRDKADGSVERLARVGDVRLDLRQALRNPDGKGLSYGFEVFATLPVGRSPVGEGTWGAGIAVPVTYDVSEKVQVGFTGEVDAQPDEDGGGRHFSSNEVVTLGVDLTEKLTGYLEGQLVQDDEPSGHARQAFGAVGASYQSSDTRAVWVEAIAGLNRDSPDVRVFGGMTALF